jgi:hypothetical protein
VSAGDRRGDHPADRDQGARRKRQLTAIFSSVPFRQHPREFDLFFLQEIVVFVTSGLNALGVRYRGHCND